MLNVLDLAIGGKLMRSSFMQCSVSAGQASCSVSVVVHNECSSRPISAVSVLVQKNAVFNMIRQKVSYGNLWPSQIFRLGVRCTVSFVTPNRTRFLGDTKQK